MKGRRAGRCDRIPAAKERWIEPHDEISESYGGLVNRRREAWLDVLMGRPAFRDLPVAAQLDALTGALETGRAVIQAPPGTGKTTVVPPQLAGLVEGRVIVTQPRRIAARSAARRLAQLSGTAPGRFAGHTVRGESTATPQTAVEFVTTGVLLRRLLRDPELAGVGGIVLDEVHERHLDGDLALAMVAELALLRDDLSVVAMSATLDAHRWAGLLGGAAVVEVPSVLHPLETVWAPFAGPATDRRGANRAFLDHLAALTRRAVAERPDDSALVFVPGVWEVEQLVDRLSGLGRPVLPLHGRLGPREQDMAMSDEGPRVVISTAVAESSLTVPGVRVVVDSCLSREPRFDRNRGTSGLVTVRCSRASATQRAGRAARLGPGLVVRCLAADDWLGLADESTPEVAHADLTGALLALACWGSPCGDGMVLPTPLPDAGVVRAEGELRFLGLIDEQGRATALGRRVASIPVEPRLGAALLSAAPRIGSRRAAEIVAFLSADDAGGLDLLGELTRIRKGSHPVSRRWRAEADRLHRLAQGDGPAALVDDEAALPLVVALARPGWISKARPGGGWISASGTGFELPRDSAPAGEWLAVWEAQRVDGAASVIRAAVALDEAAALEAGTHLLRDEVRTVWEAGRVRAREVRALGAITLSSAPVKPDRWEAERAVRQELRRGGIGAVFPWSAAADGLRRRLALLRRSLGEPWPDMGDEALAERADEWLGREILAVAEGKDKGRADLAAALRNLLPWPEAIRLDELAPERIAVPSGSSVRLDYPEAGSGGPVVLAVKLQECFGWTETPSICDGRESVLLHLLSPAGRPLAVTDDLASFWDGAYRQVRAENRGRYAKHPWPEDPLTAAATRFTNRRARG